jgi:hypothetical protein
VDPALTLQAIQDLYDLGLSLDHIARLAKFDRRHWPLLSRETVPLNFQERVLAARDRVLAEGRQAGALRVPAVESEFYQDCLFAQGFSRRWIRDESGWDGSFRRHRSINVTTARRVHDLFLAHHHEWGPNRSRATQAWQVGWLPSFCYEWEQAIPDLRPVPGSLRAEYVTEAQEIHQAPWAPQVLARGLSRVLLPDPRVALPEPPPCPPIPTSAIPRYRPSQSQRRVMAHRMRAYFGQWNDERCAAAAWWAWAEPRGHTSEDAAETLATEARPHEHHPSRGTDWRCRHPRHLGHPTPPAWGDEAEAEAA